MTRIGAPAAGARRTTPDKRSGALVSALCVAWRDNHLEEVEARADGTWSWPARVTEGFGYDPAFQPDGAYAYLWRDDHAIENTACRRCGLGPLAPRPRLRQAGGDSALTRDNKAFGVYFHWPFWPVENAPTAISQPCSPAPIDEDRFASAFKREIETTAASAPGREVSLGSFRRRHAIADEAANVARSWDAIGKILACRA